MIPTAAGHLTLVLPDGTRVPVEGPLTIGRGEDANVRLLDRTVSRTHARITLGPNGPLIEDAGSRFGTLVAGTAIADPTPLRLGTQIRLGDVTIRVDWDGPPGTKPVGGAAPAQLDAGPGETVVVPIDATLMGLRPAPFPGGGAARPRVRSGYALKRMEAGEGEDRFILRDLHGGTFLRLASADAALLELLDGNHTVIELLEEAERTVGEGGSARLARLLADLADRGLLDGVSAAQATTSEPTRLEKFFKPKERSGDWVADYFPRAYHHWGRLFFQPLIVTFLVLFALAGFGAFTYLIGRRYGTPFVVANRLLIGSAVFILGRFALVALHEVAHGLALAHYGRTAPRGGLRLILIFPYAFVDTSEAYLEPRSHRIVISAAGPASDLAMGALFSFACAAAPPGSLREVFFTLAFAAYVGAFFNLNPFLDRDGYHILVDVLREPGLRQRARQQLAQKLSGVARGEQTSPVLGRYAVAGVIWSALGAGFAIIFSLRYYDRLSALAPHRLVLIVFILFYVILFIPVVMQLVMPLFRRVRYGPTEVNRVIR